MQGLRGLLTPALVSSCCLRYSCTATNLLGDVQQLLGVYPLFVMILSFVTHNADSRLPRISDQMQPQYAYSSQNANNA